MAGGTLSLNSSTGSGEDVININPEITFFKKVFKRHTNFGLEVIEQSLNSTPIFGSTFEIEITKTGSLISDMYFEFKLPPAAGQGGRNNDDELLDYNGNSGTNLGVVENFKTHAHWVNAVGFAIIQSIELKIGSETIDRHTGLWYDIWNELTDPNRKEWSLVGKHDGDRKGEIKDTNSFYVVPLKFYFNRNPGLALPIMLLNDSIKIQITLSSLNSLLSYDYKSTANGTTSIDTDIGVISNFKFYANYVFLEANEERQIKNNPAEYLIETLTINDNLNSSSLSNLNLSNPTKELIWVFRHKQRIAVGSASSTNAPDINESNSRVDLGLNPNDIFNYSYNGLNTNLNYGTFDTFTSLQLKISNEERFNDTDAPFFRTFQPYKYHSNVPGGFTNNEKKKYIYVYSFALDPEEYQPSGTYNFSKKDDKVNFQFTGHDLTNYALTIFSLKYEFLKIYNGSVNVSNVPYSIGYTYTERFENYDEEKHGGGKFQDQNVKKKDTVRKFNNKGKNWGGLSDEYRKK